ncbi:MAG: DUF4229 domain-containing protein [Nocardioides sp.]|nr:DUF4229 domain-containing protein [Nocardioides sp.]
MKEFFVYTLLRLIMLVGAFAITVGVWNLAAPDGRVPVMWALVIAFVVSGVASYFLLNPFREKFARRVEERAARTSAKFQEMKSREDVEEPK